MFAPPKRAARSATLPSRPSRSRGRSREPVSDAPRSSPSARPPRRRRRSRRARAARVLFLTAIRALLPRPGPPRAVRTRAFPTRERLRSRTVRRRPTGCSRSCSFACRDVRSAAPARGTSCELRAARARSHRRGGDPDVAPGLRAHDREEGRPVAARPDRPGRRDRRSTVRARRAARQPRDRSLGARRRARPELRRARRAGVPGLEDGPRGASLLREDGPLRASTCGASRRSRGGSSSGSSSTR